MTGYMQGAKHDGRDSYIHKIQGTFQNMLVRSYIHKALGIHVTTYTFHVL